MALNLTSERLGRMTAGDDGEDVTAPGTVATSRPRASGRRGVAAR